jgi:fumarate hydratase class II
MNKQTRIEKDVLGEMDIPEDVYWGINTQRAIQNFDISGKTFPHIFLYSLTQVKKACLLANIDLGEIERDSGEVIKEAIDEILKEEKHLDQFPIDIFQSGSGTQTNMNMNEVIANRANEILGHPKGKKYPIHPNDHVNKSQSSNDVIPTAMHVATIASLQQKLQPSIKNMIDTLSQKETEFKDIIKVGRTHLQDAVPIPLSMEFSVYERQLRINEKRISEALNELYNIPLGGTALGTGINAPKNFAKKAVNYLSEITGCNFKLNPIKAEGISSHNTIVKVSGTLRNLSLSLLKMANDIRWMSSGPRTGLGELILPQNEPGSSIMPGKVNPTQSEMLIQVCIQVIGNDTTITFAESQGSILDLNMTKPLMISNLLESIELLSKAVSSFTNNCLKGIQPNRKKIKQLLEQNLMLVTSLTPKIGYDKAAEIAKEAFETGKTLKEILKEKNILNDEEIEEYLDTQKNV